MLNQAKSRRGMKAMPMARELLRPEDATNWDDFLDRIALERAARSAHRESFPARPWVLTGALLLVISLLLIGYAAGRSGRWWEWVAAIVLLAVVGRMIVAAVQRAEVDDERLRELDKLELAWKSHLERSWR
jgi:hypothetical protein